MNFSSKLIEEAVQAFSRLPGIGKKSALRLVLFLIRQPVEVTEQYTEALLRLRKGIKECAKCHNLSDEEWCNICANPRRDTGVICVVESIKDVLAIESTDQYRGLYHVLGGIISPIEGVGPNDLHIDSLMHRVQTEDIQEVIMAISPTIEGETTIYYLSKKLKPSGVKISAIARGVSFGGELEYADELTLGRSIVARIPYQVKSED
ncbi:MAG TPA: recombination mediator RecR [Saprospiraceae bacterium]|nr:recombination mediator RecR [Saprospiraceae bacterium]HMQ83921.1 recombination mediator RecR [Saprospiraceae bacterium]